ncbi:MAG: hypothetical protein HZB21_02750 [Deltaproteobacteria bacterium]|nr:hypothetical protein [Deltaproteobacteria bacterium]MBI5810094.1 hypothetical protein [Deltaproteobacteria bacterium]
MREKHMRRFLKYPASIILILIPAAAIPVFSEFFYTFSPPDAAVLKVSIKHSGKREVECDDIGIIKEEAEAYRKMLKESHQARMRLKKLGNCSRARHSVLAELVIDGKKTLGGSFSPGGIYKDSASFVYAKIPVPPGAHKIEFMMNDSGKEGFDYMLKEEAAFSRGRIRVIGFDDSKKRLFIR